MAPHGMNSQILICFGGNEEDVLNAENNEEYFIFLAFIKLTEFPQTGHGEGKIERKKLAPFFFKKTVATNKQDFLKELIGEFVYHPQVEWHSYSH